MTRYNKRKTPRYARKDGFANCEDAELLFADDTTLRVFGAGGGIRITVAENGRLSDYPLHFWHNVSLDICLKNIKT